MCLFPKCLFRIDTYYTAAGRQACYVFLFQQLTVSAILKVLGRTYVTYRVHMYVKSNNGVCIYRLQIRIQIQIWTYIDITGIYLRLRVESDVHVDEGCRDTVLGIVLMRLGVACQSIAMDELDRRAERWVCVC